MLLPRYSEKIKLVYYVAVIKKTKFPLHQNYVRCVFTIPIAITLLLVMNNIKRGVDDSGQITKDYTSCV